MNLYFFIHFTVLFTLWIPRHPHKKKNKNIQQLFFFFFAWGDLIHSLAVQPPLLVSICNQGIPAVIGERRKYTLYKSCTEDIHTHTDYWGLIVSSGGNWRTWRKPHTGSGRTCKLHIKKAATETWIQKGIRREITNGGWRHSTSKF